MVRPRKRQSAVAPAVPVARHVLGGHAARLLPRERLGVHQVHAREAVVGVVGEGHETLGPRLASGERAAVDDEVLREEEALREDALVGEHGEGAQRRRRHGDGAQLNALAGLARNPGDDGHALPVARSRRAGGSNAMRALPGARAQALVHGRGVGSGGGDRAHLDVPAVEPRRDAQGWRAAREQLTRGRVPRLARRVRGVVLPEHEARLAEQHAVGRGRAHAHVLLVGHGDGGRHATRGRVVEVQGRPEGLRQRRGRRVVRLPGHAVGRVREVHGRGGPVGGQGGRLDRGEAGLELEGVEAARPGHVEQAHAHARLQAREGLPGDVDGPRVEPQPRRQRHGEAHGRRSVRAQEQHARRAHAQHRRVVVVHETDAVHVPRRGVALVHLYPRVRGRVQ